MHLGHSRQKTELSWKNQKDKPEDRKTSLYFKYPVSRDTQNPLNLSIYTFSIASLRNHTLEFNFSVLAQKSEVKKYFELFSPSWFSKGEKISRKLVMYFFHLSEVFSLLCSMQYICLVTILGSMMCTKT